MTAPISNTPVENPVPESQIETLPVPETPTETQQGLDSQTQPTDESNNTGLSDDFNWSDIEMDDEQTDLKLSDTDADSDAPEKTKRDLKLSDYEFKKALAEGEAVSGKEEKVLNQPILTFEAAPEILEQERREAEKEGKKEKFEKTLKEVDVLAEQKLKEAQDLKNKANNLQKSNPNQAKALLVKANTLENQANQLKTKIAENRSDLARQNEKQFKKMTSTGKELTPDEQKQLAKNALAKGLKPVKISSSGVLVDVKTNKPVKSDSKQSKNNSDQKNNAVHLASSNPKTKEAKNAQGSEKSEKSLSKETSPESIKKLELAVTQNVNEGLRKERLENFKAKKELLRLNKAKDKLASTKDELAQAKSNGSTELPQAVQAFEEGAREYCDAHRDEWRAMELGVCAVYKEKIEVVVDEKVVEQHNEILLAEVGSQKFFENKAAMTNLFSGQTQKTKYQPDFELGKKGIFGYISPHWRSAKEREASGEVLIADKVDLNRVVV